MTSDERRILVEISRIIRQAAGTNGQRYEHVVQSLAQQLDTYEQFSSARSVYLVECSKAIHKMVDDPKTTLPEAIAFIPPGIGEQERMRLGGELEAIWRLLTIEVASLQAFRNEVNSMHAILHRWQAAIGMPLEQAEANAKVEVQVSQNVSAAAEPSKQPTASTVVKAKK